MGKQLNQWLDEFIENGADASDVTNWPENAGGGDGGEIIVPESGESEEYTIDVNELLRLVEDREEEIEENPYYIFGNSCELNGSGNVYIDQCINLQRDYTSSDSAIYINDSVIATIDRNSFTSWYDFISDNRAIIEQQYIILSLKAVLVGVIRNSDYMVVGKFDISKLLKKVEQSNQE